MQSLCEQRGNDRQLHRRSKRTLLRKEPCFVCDECRWYDGDTKNPDKWKQECDEYIITEEQAKRNRKKFKIVK